jgi:hypothetical protein
MGKLCLGVKYCICTVELDYTSSSHLLLQLQPCFSCSVLKQQCCSNSGGDPGRATGTHFTLPQCPQCVPNCSNQTHIATTAPAALRGTWPQLHRVGHAPTSQNVSQLCPHLSNQIPVTASLLQQHSCPSINCFCWTSTVPALLWHQLWSSCDASPVSALLQLIYSDPGEGTRVGTGVRGPGSGRATTLLPFISDLSDLSILFQLLNTGWDHLL